MFALGGLQDLGFAESSDLLLVVSTAGRGLYDLLSGERLARDPDDSYTWFDAYNLRCQGVGLLTERLIRTAGLSGGGLALESAEGWWLETADDQQFLLKPFKRSKPRRRWPLPGGAGEFRAAGFSPTGRSLVCASSADFTVYLRAN